MKVKEIKLALDGMDDEAEVMVVRHVKAYQGGQELQPYNLFFSLHEENAVVQMPASLLVQNWLLPPLPETDENVLMLRIIDDVEHVDAWGEGDGDYDEGEEWKTG